MDDPGEISHSSHHILYYNELVGQGIQEWIK